MARKRVPLIFGLNTPNIPSPFAVGQILYDTGSVYALLPNGTTGQVLAATTGAAPAWSSSGVISNLTSPRIPYVASSTTLADTGFHTWDNTNAQEQVGMGATSGGRFFAIGAQTTVFTPNRNTAVAAYSADGTDWASAGDGLFGTFSPQSNGLCFNGTKFVACLSSARMAYSTDGMAWTVVDVSSLISSVNSVCWNGTKFVAVGAPLTSGGTGKISITSTDGISWAQGSAGTLTATFTPVSICWSGSLFAAVGGDGVANGVGIVTSTDGLSWTPRASGLVGTSGTCAGTCVFYGGGLFLATGNNNAGDGTTTLTTSPDGITWTSRTGPSTQPSHCISYNGTNYVIGDAGGLIIWTATPTVGGSWANASPTNPRGTNGDIINSIAWNGVRFVGVGSLAGSVSQSFVVYSTDGATWTKPTLTAPQGQSVLSGVAVVATTAPDLTPAIKGPSPSNGITADTISAPGALTLSPIGQDVVIALGKNLKVQNAAEGYTAAIDANLRVQFSPYPRTFRNALLNGSMIIDQRKEGGAYSATGYTLDRYLFALGTGAAGSVTKTAVAPGATTPPNALSAVTIARTTTGTTATTFEQRIEGVETFAGFPVVFSFWANFSTGTAPNPTINLIQNFGTGGSPSTTVTTALVSGFTMAAGWKFYSFTTTLPSVSTKTKGTGGNDYLAVQFSIPTSVGNTNFLMTQLQFELGSVPTTYDYRPTAIEMPFCQRYHHKTFNQGVAEAQNSASLLGSLSFTGAVASQTFTCQWRFPVVMRAAPTITTYCPNAATANWTTVTTAPVAATNNIGQSGAGIQGTTNVTAGSTYNIHASADAEL